MSDLTHDSVDELRPARMSLPALFVRFLMFGCLVFGGPVAQIAMIRRDLIERDRWMSPGHFNRLLAVMQVLPGPEAHELCVHLGIRARGRLGGLLAGIGFMLPGLVLMMAAAWAYVTFGDGQAGLAAAFLGIQVAVMDMAGLQTLLAGVAAGVVGIIAATTLQLAWATVPRLPTLWPALPIFAAALAIVYLWKSRFNAVVIVALAGLAGALAFG